jgi:hypothetical protein
VTVVVRWAPELAVRYGTQVARLAEAKGSDLDGVGRSACIGSMPACSSLLMVVPIDGSAFALAKGSTFLTLPRLVCRQCAYIQPLCRSLLPQCLW